MCGKKLGGAVVGIVMDIASTQLKEKRAKKKKCWRVKVVRERYI